MAEIKCGYSMYDFNASLVKNYPPLKWAGLNKAKFIINDFHNNHKNRYYIALCHNLRYFTVYDTKPNDIKINLSVSFGAEVIDCSSNLGEILDVQISDNKQSVEIWVKQNSERGAECVVLIPYDKGIVKVGEIQNEYND